MEEETLFNIVLISMLVMVGLAMTIIILFNLSQKRILLEQKEAHNNELEFQKELLLSNIKTQENERSRIARELHDDIGSKLNVINLNLRFLKAICAKGENPETVVDHINTALKSSIERTREISHQLMPAILTKFGIKSALNSLATSINKTGQIEVYLEIDDIWGELDKMKELHIYRIIQELTTNSLKHAKAKNISITSKIKTNILTIVYTDDGVGIKDKVTFMTGLGISNINARSKLLNAESQLITETSTGMQFEISIPI